MNLLDVHPRRNSVRGTTVFPAAEVGGNEKHLSSRSRNLTCGVVWDWIASPEGATIGGHDDLIVGLGIVYDCDRPVLNLGKRRTSHNRRQDKYEEYSHLCLPLGH